MKLPFGFGELAERLRRSTVLIGSSRGGQGAGVIVDAGGSIVTNAHVVRSGEHRVQLWDGRSLSAELNKRDAQQDLALLRRYLCFRAQPVPQSRDVGWYSEPTAKNS